VRGESVHDPMLVERYLPRGLFLHEHE
jgi:hypothetical protein